LPTPGKVGALVAGTPESQRNRAESENRPTLGEFRFQQFPSPFPLGVFRKDDELALLCYLIAFSKTLIGHAAFQFCNKNGFIEVMHSYSV
jgi:hypothetical protein